MDLRETFQRHPWLGRTAAGLLVLTFALACFLRFRTPGPRSPKLWYYDVGTGQLFTARSANPPIHAPSGQDGVIAHVFACGNCADPAHRATAYIETQSPELQKAQAHTIEAGTLMNPRPGDPAFLFATAAGGHLVAKPEASPHWVSINSDEGQAILEAQTPCPDGQAPKRCTPQ